MKINQKNIYSLLEPIKSELMEETQTREANGDSAGDAPEGGIKAAAKDGEILKGLVEDQGKKAGDSEAINSPDFIEREFCPRCEETALVRVRRRKWMRFLPQSSHYQCLECKARFLVVWRLEMELLRGKS